MEKIHPVGAWKLMGSVKVNLKLWAEALIARMGGLVPQRGGGRGVGKELGP